MVFYTIAFKSRVTIEHARSRRGRGGGPGMGGGRFSPRFGGYRQSRSGGSRYVSVAVFYTSGQACF